MALARRVNNGRHIPECVLIRAYKNNSQYCESFPNAPSLPTLDLSVQSIGEMGELPWPRSCQEHEQVTLARRENDGVPYFLACS